MSFWLCSGDTEFSTAVSRIVFYYSIVTLPFNRSHSEPTLSVYDGNTDRQTNALLHTWEINSMRKAPPFLPAFLSSSLLRLESETQRNSRKRRISTFSIRSTNSAWSWNGWTINHKLTILSIDAFPRSPSAPLAQLGPETGSAIVIVQSVNNYHEFSHFHVLHSLYQLCLVLKQLSINQWFSQSTHFHVLHSLHQLCLVFKWVNDQSSINNNRWMTKKPEGFWTMDKQTVSTSTWYQPFNQSFFATAGSTHSFPSFRFCSLMA